MSKCKKCQSKCNCPPGPPGPEGPQGPEGPEGPPSPPEPVPGARLGRTKDFSPVKPLNQTPIAFEAAATSFDGPGPAMFDEGSFPTRLTIQSAGRYHVSGAVIWGDPEDSKTPRGTFRNLGIRLNNTTYLALSTDDPITSTGGQGQINYTFAEFKVNDYVELVVEHNAGSDLAILKLSPPFDGASPVFAITKI